MEGQEQQPVEQVSSQEVERPRSSDVAAPDIKRPRKMKKFKLGKIIIIVLVLALLGGGGWFLLKEPQFGEESTETESLMAPEITETPTPTSEKETIDRDEISIEILNGTGIAKEASYLQDKLANIGYSKIELGNVGEQEYEVATVTFSSTLDESVVDEITQELEDIYNDVSTKTSSSLDVDVQIITGLRAGQSIPTSAPTSSPTSSPSATPAS